MRWLIAILSLGLMLLAGCNDGKPQQQAATHAAAGSPAQPSISLTLIRSDLGLADGSYVREVDAWLSEAAKQQLVVYTPAGELPRELQYRPETEDIGMPQVQPQAPGEMTLTAAIQLLDNTTACDWLLLTAPQLLLPALERIDGGQLKAGGVILLDDETLGQLPEQPPVPVVVVHYRIKDVAFLCGVAAAASSPNAQFFAFAAENDLQGQEFMDAAAAGAKYQANGSFTYSALVPVGSEGIVTRSSFAAALAEARAAAGSNFSPNHYIVALGRATPSIINGLCLPPYNSYIACGYADFRVLWPERTICCAVKRPAQALQHILESAGYAPSALAALAPTGRIELGLDVGAVGYTDTELYSRYNKDGPSIAVEVEAAAALIRVGELDYPY